MSIAASLAFIPLAVWIYLLTGRGMFWLARDRDDNTAETGAPSAWPCVAAVVPARDEAGIIACAAQSLLAQDYPGAFRIIVVDDQSTDETAAVVRALEGGGRLHLVSGTARPPGWTGKPWAMSQGVSAAGSEPDYLWFTDADIAHTPDNLRRLVLRAETGRLAMVSLMARLRCRSLAEKLLIPGFVFFFQMLFPFRRVNRPDSPVAAAAGGCMLVRREALERAGGIAAIRHEIIDDCALARRLKTQGPIWLGLTERAVSLRAYPGLRDIRHMVARSAYAQLSYSPAALALVVAAMLGIYLAPPLLLFLGTGPARIAGGLARLCMFAAFVPMVRFYRLWVFWALLLPVVAVFYVFFTLDSAFQHWRGRGGLWKGRVQAPGRA